jgi:hypothetical protein
VVSPGVIRDTLSASSDPEQAVGRLIDLANEAGGPDNIACVVADVVEPRPGLSAPGGQVPRPPPGGSAAADQAEMAGPASISGCRSPAWPTGGVSRLYRGPGRNRIAATIEPPARMPAVHQNAVS